MKNDGKDASEESFAEEEIKYCGPRRYISANVITSVCVEKVHWVPDNIVGLKGYEVPLQRLLDNWKSKRLWCVAQTIKRPNLKEGPPLDLNCRGSCV